MSSIAKVCISMCEVKSLLICETVEVYLQQLIHTGVVSKDASLADIKVDCWSR